MPGPNRNYVPCFTIEWALLELEHGASMSHVAEVYDVSYGTVAKWKKRSQLGSVAVQSISRRIETRFYKLAPNSRPSVAEQKRFRIGDWLDWLDREEAKTSNEKDGRLPTYTDDSRFSTLKDLHRVENNLDRVRTEIHSIQGDNSVRFEQQERRILALEQRTRSPWQKFKAWVKG